MRQLRRQAGFTLIEILVVVLVIAIILSALVVPQLSLLGDDRQLQTEANRFVSLVDVAKDDATLQGRDFGLEFLSQGFRFVEWDPYSEQWTELFDETLRPRQLPDAAEFELYLEEKQIPLENEAAAFDAEDDRELRDYAPHVLIYSSGDATPFELHFVDYEFEHRVTVVADLDGTVEVVVDEE